MDILIAGAGNMARGIAARLLAGHRTVRIADRDRQKAEALAFGLDGDATAQAFTGPGDAGVVVLAVPYPANVEIARDWADRLTGRIVVDIANPVDFATFDDVVTPPGSSAAEEVAAAAPGAHVVKAFNTTFAVNLVGGAPMDVFIAADDEDAAGTVARLVADGGLRPVRVGGLKHARTLEGLALLHMKVQDQIDGGFSTVVSFAAAD